MAYAGGFAVAIIETLSRLSPVQNLRLAAESILSSFTRSAIRGGILAAL